VNVASGLTYLSIETAFMASLLLTQNSTW